MLRSRLFLNIVVGFLLFSLLIPSLSKQYIAHAAPGAKLTVTSFTEPCVGGSAVINAICDPGTVYLSHQCDYIGGSGDIARSLIDSFEKVGITVPIAVCTLPAGTCVDGTSISMSLFCAE